MVLFAADPKTRSKPGGLWLKEHRGSCLFTGDQLSTGNVHPYGEVGVTFIDNVFLVIYYRSLAPGDLYAFDAQANKNDMTRW